MKSIFLLFCSILLPVFSLNEITPKICINCKFFTKNVMNDNIYGKCRLYPTTERNDDFFVTGIEKNVDYYYCSTVRNNDHMCGKEGKKYIENPCKIRRFIPFLISNAYKL